VSLAAYEPSLLHVVLDVLSGSDVLVLVLPTSASLGFSATRLLHCALRRHAGVFKLVRIVNLFGILQVRRRRDDGGGGKWRRWWWWWLWWCWWRWWW
jgi:hypothetical protein